MHLAQETPEEFKRVDQRAKEVLAELLSQIKPSVSGVRISSNQDVFSAPNRTGKLYVLKDGVLGYSINNHILFYFEAGDLVGAEHFLTNPEAKILSDFAVVVDEYDGTAFLSAVGQSAHLQKKWSEYLVLQSSLLATLSLSAIAKPSAATPDVRNFSPGEVIVSEGSSSNEVFALVEGTAEASVNGKSAGEIKEGEIFGVLAALTSVQRNATVTAKDFCLVMVFPRDEFVQMVESKPAMILKMIEDMGRTVAALNEHGLAMSFSKF